MIRYVNTLENTSVLIKTSTSEGKRTRSHDDSKQKRAKLKKKKFCQDCNDTGQPE
eukprot:CAMPEP_0171304240 /NCGR_PEP_ID=MMETSP0816-20121228/13943_1 /TAXON_ID=420281 /ORGANISM="Proboscia inermis, Strain CCAP1064/1" /LENGTH=54 /DNA_ID=CAMNT_0011784171 /DNA_START=751 /DNA_END=915 /DNA_ORIENTATION=+